MTRERFFEIAMECGLPEKLINGLWDTRPTDDLNETALRQSILEVLSTI